MWRTNLKIVATVLVTIGVYTGISNVIPQVESEVPQRMEIGSDVSVGELVSLGEQIYHGAGACETCHGLGTRAPELLGTIGTRCGDRVPEMSCKEYLHESLVAPGEHVVDGFQPIMPDMEAQLSDGQIWALVAFLQSQGGEVTVSPDDLSTSGGDDGATETDAAAAAGDGGPAAAEGGGEEMALFRRYQCITCHRMEGQGGEVGPPVAAIRERGLPPDYLRRSILSPNADTASGYETDYSAYAGTMPTNFGDRLSEEELDRMVEILSGGGR